VLEANAKVNAIGEISHPHPPKPLNQFGCVKKTGLGMGFFVDISIRLSVIRHANINI